MLTTTVSTITYNGNDVTTSFDYPFKIFIASELEVWLTDSEGTESQVTSNFNISGAGDDAGGSIVYPVTGTPTPTGTKITLRRVLTVAQDFFDPANNTAFQAEVLETSADKTVAMIQQVKTDVDRALRGSLSSSIDPELPDAEAGKVLAWNAAENAIVNLPVAGGVIAEGAIGDTELADVLNAQTVNELTVATKFVTNDPYIDVRAHGAVADDVDAAATNTAAFASAIAAAPSGGVVSVPPGVFTMAVAGDNPYAAGKYVIDLSTNNLTFYISKGATIKLADGQQTDAGGAVAIITAQDVDGLTITGGGRITGNTAGQTGWSGGYGQVSNGVIIYIADSTGSSNININNLQLDDHWSNPINIDGAGAGTTNVNIKNIFAFDCGEGPQVVSAHNVRVENVTFMDTSDVAVGDGIELSAVVNFVVDGCIVKSNGAGAAFDLYGSTYGVLSNFVVEEWTGGLSLGTAAGTVPDWITIGPGILKNLSGTPILPGDGNYLFHDIVVTGATGTTFAIETSGAAALPIVIVNNSTFEDNAYGALIRGDRKVIFNNCNFNNNGLAGVIVQRVTTQVPSLWLNNCYAKDSTYGVYVDGQGSAFSPTVVLSGGNYEGNATANIRAVNNADLDNLRVRHVDFLPTMFQVLPAAPTPYPGLLEGMVAYVNGSSWNPGGGSGLYLYDGAVWEKISIGGTIPVMTTGNATPSVQGMKYLRSLGTNSITDFADGVEGQVVTFIAETSITITDGTNIFLNGSSNFDMTATDTLTLLCKADNKWYELSRGDNGA